jgi:hypothetical protein
LLRGTHQYSVLVAKLGIDAQRLAAVKRRLTPLTTTIVEVGQHRAPERMGRIPRQRPPQHVLGAVVFLRGQVDLRGLHVEIHIAGFA